jgi:hypothetical protein
MGIFDKNVPAVEPGLRTLLDFAFHPLKIGLGMQGARMSE